MKPEWFNIYSCYNGSRVFSSKHNIERVKGISNDSFAVCRLPFAVCRLPFAVCRLPLVVTALAFSQCSAKAGVYSNPGPPNVSVSPTATISGSVPVGSHFALPLEDAPAEVFQVADYTIEWTGRGTPYDVNINAQFNLFTTTDQVSASPGSAATTDLWVSVPTAAHSHKVIDPGGNINGTPAINQVFDAPPARKAGANTVTHELEVRGQAKATIQANPVPSGSASASITGDFSLTSVTVTPAP